MLWLASLPYFLLTARPGWLRFVPKPGMWMERVKQLMGFVMLAVAVWLFGVLALRGPDVAEWRINQFIYEESDHGIEAMVRSVEGDTARLELVQDYRSSKHSVWGISARNREQNFALNLLLDPAIDLVTILGPAGTGKTLLTLAAGLMQTLDSSLFAEIIMTRVTIPLGEDIGFLPGTEEEKMEPWMGALMDNLEVLTHSAEGDVNVVEDLIPMRHWL